MIDVTLDVKGNSDLLKVDWRSPSAGEAAYSVDINRLITRSAAVRDRLQDLIAAAMRNRAAHQPLTLGFELKQLAKAGSRLRSAIFLAEAGRDEQEGPAAERWLASLSEAVKIHVTIDRQ